LDWYPGAGDAIDRPDNQDESGSLGPGQGAAEAENDTALILVQDSDAAQQIDGNHHSDCHAN
jgi:hypothetical protein